MDTTETLSKESIQKLLDESKSLSILFTGKTGAGKSSLANALVGTEVSPEGETLDPQTMEVSSLTTKIEGVDVTIWDSPGLQDGTNNEAKYLENMADKCKELDLVLYCSRMDDTRIRHEDHEAIRTLTRAFGEAIWKNAVFTLTFANWVKLSVRGREVTPQELKEHFQRRHIQWETKLREAVEKSGVSNAIASAIPVVPVGYVDNLALPDCENWLKEFWLTCLKRLGKRAKLALIKSNIRRLTKPPGNCPASQVNDELDMSVEDLETALTMAFGGFTGFVLGGVLGVVGGPVGLVAGAAIGMLSSTAITGTHIVLKERPHEQEPSKKQEDQIKKKD